MTPLRWALVCLVGLTLASCGEAVAPPTSAPTSAPSTSAPSASTQPTKTYLMPSASMEPTYVAGDRVTGEVVDDYDPVRGDVVVFQDPGGWLVPVDDPDATRGKLLKRVIGLPGDSIVCCDDRGRLVVDGEPLDEDYVVTGLSCNGPMVNACRAGWSAEVPEDRLFVMGDNRAASADSSDHLCKRGPDVCADVDQSGAFVPVELVEAVVR